MAPEVARRLLGVSARATAAEVDVAYRAAVRTAHPDVGGDAARFAELTAARRVLAGPASASRARSVPPLVVRHSRRRRVLHAVRVRLSSIQPRVR
jgi:acetylornithine/succinyldiaminopimelate/putrescine aminotransferase